MTSFKPGDRVIHTGADDPDALPAMKIMFGRVVALPEWSAAHLAVRWDCGGLSFVSGRPPNVVTEHKLIFGDTYRSINSQDLGLRHLSPEDEAHRIKAHNTQRLHDTIVEVQRRYDAACADNKPLRIRLKE